MVGIPAGWDQRPPPKLNPRTYAFFRPDRVSFQEFLLSEQVRNPTVAVANAIMATAKVETPRGKDGKDGHMQDDYFVVREAGVITVGDSFPYPRVLVEIGNKNKGSAAVEFGNRGRKGRRMLGRAGAAFGDMKGKIGT